jgi:hypothetical protein
MTERPTTRLMGSETEYTTKISNPLDERVNPNLTAYHADRNNLWLKNGGRLYIDCNAVVEYATPECTKGAQVLLHERVGEIIVRSVSDTTSSGYEAESYDKQFPVYKRTGYAGFTKGEGDGQFKHRADLSTGHHETYQLFVNKQQFYTPRNIHFLNTYLATRVAWTGAGLVGSKGYMLSQKARGINFDGASLTAHGQKVPYRPKGGGLIEIRTGEGNMSDWVVEHKFDMTSLVLRMIEHDIIPHNVLLELGSETAAMRTTSLDPTLGLTCHPDCDSDTTKAPILSAIDIQQAIAAYGIKHGERIGAPTHELKAAHDVLEACAVIEKYFYDDTVLKTISDRIDWAAKLDKLQSRGMALGQITCNNLVAVAHDLSWEDISPAGSARRWYRRKGTDIFSDHDIRRNVATPPTQRARDRVDLLTEHSGTVRLVDWDHITLKDDTSVPIEPPKLTSRL